MSFNILYNQYNNDINSLMGDANKNTRVQKNKISNNNLLLNNNISEFKLSNNASVNQKILVSGDRFIPYKNDNNIQNFILNSSPFNNNSSYSKKNDSLSSSEKHEKNYVNFIIDNMLKNSSDDYIIQNEKIRKNTIFSFSKNIYKTANKKKIRKTLNNNEDINNNNLNLTEKHNKSCIGDALFNGIDQDTSNELLNNINIFIGNNKKGIISQDNNLLNINYKYNKIHRKIQKTPLRVLDAPNLLDDFYLNLLDWGKENIIAVALSNEIYLWNDNNCQTCSLMTYENQNNDISSEDSNNQNNITSLSFMNNGICIAVGLPDGKIQLWDINKKKKIREFEAHKDRVTCLAWNGYILTSGSKDRFIKNFDVRNRNPEISEIKKHKQEVCSLKYSIEGDLLASGGNDNVAYIWDIRNIKNNIFNFLFNENNEIKPYSVNNFHQAAVKAMAWCPWKRHVLATGGGSKDKTIKIYSCDNNKLLKNINSGSQVCALIWNQKEKEIISSHGYNKNQIIIWNYEKCKKISELKGHMNRVLYLALSPDERFICSGSGDETLRFWKINDEPINNCNQNNSNSMYDKVIIH